MYDPAITPPQSVSDIRDGLNTFYRRARKAQKERIIAVWEFVRWFDRIQPEVATGRAVQNPQIWLRDLIEGWAKSGVCWRYSTCLNYRKALQGLTLEECLAQGSIRKACAFGRDKKRTPAERAKRKQSNGKESAVRIRELEAKVAELEAALVKAGSSRNALRVDPDNAYEAVRAGDRTVAFSIMRGAGVDYQLARLIAYGDEPVSPPGGTDRDRAPTALLLKKGRHSLGRLPRVNNSKRVGYSGDVRASYGLPNRARLEVTTPGRADGY